jgi:hypothetical protein
MKSRFTLQSAAILAGMGLLVSGTTKAGAQDTAPATTAPNAATSGSASATPPVKLSYGVPEVLKLARAQVSDDTIVAFVQNSGTVYSLSAGEIVYLHGQGVPDRVISAMLDNRRNVTTPAAAAPAAPAQATAPAQTTYAAAAPTYNVAPSYTPSSSTYVIPYSPPTYYYDYPYNYWPYYYGGWGYPYSGVSFSFG